MPDLLQALHCGRVLLMDGAMGTELQRAGIRPGECHELWNLTHPERVLAIHRANVEAGAICLVTNTFQANRAALDRHGLADQLGELIRAGIDLARAAAGPECFVLADVGPVERPDLHVTRAMLEPMGRADGILVETCSDLGVVEAVLAGRAAFGAAALPVLLSLTYLRDGAGELRTFAGLTPQEGARRAAALGVAAVGVNCGREIEMADCAAILRAYRAVIALPLFARPNAGTPVRREGDTVHPRSPQAMAAGLPPLLEAGVALVGGCCGTTADHVAAFRPVLEGRHWHP